MKEQFRPVTDVKGLDGLVTDAASDGEHVWITSGGEVSQWEYRSRRSRAVELASSKPVIQRSISARNILLRIHMHGACKTVTLPENEKVPAIKLALLSKLCREAFGTTTQLRSAPEARRVTPSAQEWFQMKEWSTPANSTADSNSIMS